MSFFTDKFSGKKFFRKIEFDHVEFYTSNAKQTAYFYKNAFGFNLFAYRGPETGNFDTVSYVFIIGPLEPRISYDLPLPIVGRGIFVIIRYRGVLGRGHNLGASYLGRRF